LDELQISARHKGAKAQRRSTKGGESKAQRGKGTKKRHKGAKAQRHKVVFIFSTVAAMKKALTKHEHPGTLILRVK